MPRPVFEDGEPNESLSERQQRFRDLAEKLVADVPEDREVWSDEHHALYRLANLLEWHWREDKVSWWEFYRLVDLDAEERAALLAAGCLAVLNFKLKDQTLIEALHTLVERRRRDARDRCHDRRADGSEP